MRWLSPGKLLFHKNWTSNGLLLLVVAFLIVAGNLSLHSKILQAYPLSSQNALPVATLPLTLACFTLLVLAPFCFGRATRWLLGLILILSSFAAYFMDNFGVVISEEMLQNALQTNLAEARDLFSFKLVGYFLFIGLLPTLAIFKLSIRWRGWRTEILARIKLIVVCLVLLACILAGFSSFYASFLRGQKAIRPYANPTAYIWAVINLVKNALPQALPVEIKKMGMDAQISPDRTERRLIVVVVGETARADHFSLNGYPRLTTPKLQQENVFTFTNFWACGTSTAVSVPCMFSFLGTEHYDDQQAQEQENVLDVLQRAGASVLWLDNNSNSKGVALRVPYEDFKSPNKNPICEEECRDEGLLPRVEEAIKLQKTGDIVIVLHQMGNHGPAYYKRYPAAFETFTPVCKNKDLSQCSKEEIINAYDNAILYTDHFLARVISLLKQNDKQFATALFYLSDHGESLGENGVYLHGLPRAFAPDAQLHVPAVMWFGQGFYNLDRKVLGMKNTERLSHDHLPHTLLGLLGIQTSLYRPELDILRGSLPAGKVPESKF